MTARSDERLAPRAGPLLSWGRVLRLSLAPSALADVAAGLVVGGGGEFPPFASAWPLLAASACVYHGGMALNDWADRAHDARTRPERPIPSGALRSGHVLAVGACMLLLAVAFALAHSLEAGLWTAGLAALVLLYDIGPRGGWLGPLLLGACRAGNLSLGLRHATVGALAAPAHGWWLALLYGAYVTCASFVAREEDRDSDAAPGHVRALAFATAALLLGPALIDIHTPALFSPDPAAALLALVGAVGLWRAALTTPVWTRAACGRFTGMALRRLLVFSATVALAHRSQLPDAPWTAALILAGFPISLALRRAFPPT